MELRHHGVVLQMADDDPRVAVIETLVFGRPLPPPFPAPPAPVAPSPPPAPPPVVVPPELAALWARLAPVERREFMLLRQRPWRPAELEAALGIPEGRLTGRHSRLARLASNAGARLHITAKGGRRERRRYTLDPATVANLDLLIATGLATPEG